MGKQEKKKKKNTSKQIGKPETGSYHKLHGRYGNSQLRVNSKPRDSA